MRQHDPAQPGGVITVPADLTPFLASGLLTLCQPDDPQEQARFIHYAAQFRSDGEAMCLAIAEARGWTVATDDRKAIRVAGQAGLTVMSCPELVKAWADRDQAGSRNAGPGPGRYPDARPVPAESDDARGEMVVQADALALIGDDTCGEVQLQSSPESSMISQSRGPSSG